MFGKKTIQTLREENQKAREESRKENQKLRDELEKANKRIAELSWEDCKNERGILIDASGLFRCGDTLDKLKGKKAFSWAAKKQLEDFHEDAIHLTRTIRSAFLNKTLVSEAVIEAIASGEIRLPFRFEKRLIRAVVRKRDEGSSAEEVDKERDRQIRRLLKRCRQILSIWPLFKERFDTGEWRTVSSDSNLYHEVLNSVEKFQVKNGNTENNKATDDEVVDLIETEEMTLGEAIGSADSRIIAAALVMQERFKEVVIIARDRRLREAAEAKGIQVASTVEEISRLQKELD